MKDLREVELEFKELATEPAYNVIVDKLGWKTAIQDCADLAEDVVQAIWDVLANHAQNGDSDE